MRTIHTLASGTHVNTEIEIKRSRFLATVARTDTPEDARALVDLLRAEHPQARHTCSAWLLQPADLAPQAHSSDDGEPAGTAGTPMLNVLRTEDVWNVTAVVTRYFGGVLLGAGGLVRAYSQAVSEALALAPRARLEERDVLLLTVPTAEAGRLESEVRHAGAHVIETTWGTRTTFRLGVAPSAREALEGRIASLTQGASRLEPAGTTFVEVPENT